MRPDRYRFGYICFILFISYAFVDLVYAMNFIQCLSIHRTQYSHRKTYASQKFVLESHISFIIFADILEVCSVISLLWCWGKVVFQHTVVPAGATTTVVQAMTAQSGIAITAQAAAQAQVRDRQIAKQVSYSFKKSLYVYWTSSLV